MISASATLTSSTDKAHRKTSVTIDEDLLTAAREALQTTTIRETIEAALLEAVQARARRQETAALTRMEGMNLDDSDVMKDAWRQ